MSCSCHTCPFPVLKKVQLPVRVRGVTPSLTLPPDAPKASVGCFEELALDGDINLKTGWDGRGKLMKYKHHDAVQNPSRTLSIILLLNPKQLSHWLVKKRGPGTSGSLLAVSRDARWRKVYGKTNQKVSHRCKRSFLFGSGKKGSSSRRTFPLTHPLHCHRLVR